MNTECTTYYQINTSVKTSKMPTWSATQHPLLFQLQSDMREWIKEVPPGGDCDGSASSNMLTHSLSAQPGQATASLRYMAPSSSIRLAIRSRISRVGFCFRTSARWRMPSRVTRLLQGHSGGGLGLGGPKVTQGQLNGRHYHPEFSCAQCIHIHVNILCNNKHFNIGYFHGMIYHIYNSVNCKEAHPPAQVQVS